MRVSKRKLILVVGALVALLLAGTAGAVVRYTIFTIPGGGHARLAGTQVDCYSHPTAEPRFICVLQGANGWPPPGAVGAVISTGGVIIEQWTNSSNHGYVVVRKYYNNP